MTAARTIRVIEPTDVLWRRIGAFLIDEALAVAGALITTAVVAGFSVATFVVALLAWLVGFAAIQAFTGATPGMHAVGLRVVTASGDRAGPRRNAIRSGAWVVDGFPYVVPLVGYAAAFGDRDAQRLGDRWAGTYVVDKDLVGQPPFTVAFPGDGSAPHRLETRAAYLPPGPVNALRRPASALAEAELAAASADALTAGPETVDTAAEVVGFGAPRPTAADAAAVLALSPPQADLVLDPATGAYTRFDADAGQWLVFDEERRQWRPATAEPTLVALPSSAPRPPLR
jgi:uncharacterized RDD family membrane protein YckC